MMGTESIQASRTYRERIGECGDVQFLTMIVIMFLLVELSVLYIHIEDIEQDLLNINILYE